MSCWPQVLFTGLTPSTRYYYRVGGLYQGAYLWSSEFSFVSAPAPGPAQSVKMAVYGDMGTVMPLVRRVDRHDSHARLLLAHLSLRRRSGESRFCAVVTGDRGSR
jgi:hypothetical protein